MVTFHNVTAEVDQKIHLDTTNDFTLVCSDKVVVPVNKEAFSKLSPVIKAMFQTDMIDQMQDITKIVDIDSKTMPSLVSFIQEEVLIRVLKWQQNCSMSVRNMRL